MMTTSAISIVLIFYWTLLFFCMLGCVLYISLNILMMGGLVVEWICDKVEMKRRKRFAHDGN